MSTTNRISIRRPAISGLGKLTLAALGGATLTALAMAVRMYRVAGEIPPPVIVLAILFGLAGATVALRWRWAPFLGALVGALLILLFAPHLPHLLAVPSDTVFTPAVLLVGFALVSAVLGTMAGVQNYRRRAEERVVPRWIPFQLAGMGGLLAGIFLMAAVAQPTAAAGIAPEILEGLPAIETEKFEFVQQEIRVRAGETVALRLLNRDAASHSFDIDELGVHVFMPPNETAVALFSAGEPGTYTIYCAPHYDRKTGQGMKSTLIVEP